MVAETRIAASTDFYGLSQLKSRAAQQDPKALGEAARQFEALFLQMMLKSMRDAGAAFAEDRDRSYDDMLDRQLAVELAREGSVGIADLLVEQIAWRDREPSTETTKASDASIVPGTGLSTRRREDFRPTDEREFFNDIWPLARAAAEELGIDPRAIVAQAALETGWGRHIIRDGRGVSSNNLFGIKVGNGWGGARVAALTLEHDAAAGFVPKVEAFRAYATLAEGFSGYAEFLRTSPRYGAALALGQDGAAFAGELQSAGYATDPRYADKIRAILESPRFAVYLNGHEGAK